MAVEIEAKIRLGDDASVAALVDALEAAGAHRVGVVLSTEVYLDRPDGSLQMSDSGLRVRIQEPDEAPSAATPGTGTGTAAATAKAWVTFKGPREPGEFKVREEIESQIGDGEAVLALLSKLGYVPNVRYQKRRETWRMDDCTVELDQVPLLGRFVEIEGPSEAAVSAVRKQLGLEATPVEKHAYVSLLMKELKRRGDDRRVITLND